MKLLSDPLSDTTEQADMAIAARRRRQRSVALLVVLFALSGLFYAISIVRISDMLAVRSTARPAVAP